MADIPKKFKTPLYLIEDFFDRINVWGKKNIFEVPVQGVAAVEDNEFVIKSQLPSLESGPGSIQEGSGISLTGDLANRLFKEGTLIISHDDTSDQVTVTNSNGTLIQSLTLDDFGHLIGVGSLDGDNRWARLISAIASNSTWSHTSLQNGIDFTPYTTGSSGYPSTLGFAVAFYANTSDSTSGFGRAFALNRAYNTENYYLGSPNTSGVHNGWRLIFHSGNLDVSTFALKAQSTTSVIHGSDNTVARPVGWGRVEWFGTVEPLNMIDYDTWTDTTV